MWPFSHRVKQRQQMSLEELLAESGTPTWAGVQVGADEAMRLSAVWACVRLLADSVSTLPVDVFRRGEREPLEPPPILVTPAAGWSLHEWLEAVMRSLLLRGNAYGLVVARGADLRPTQVELVSPDAMTAKVNREGMIEYRLHGKPWPAEDTWHVKAYRMPGLVVGLSPVEHARQQVGLGLAVERYGATWFGDGGIPTGTFKNTELTLEQEQADEIKARLVNAIRTRQPMVHGKDWQFTPIAVKPDESQFIETAKLNVAAIARIYGVPPEMIAAESGNSLTYSNVEQRSLDFLIYGVSPWLVRLERALGALLPRRQYVKFNANALLRTTTKDRYEAHKTAIEAGLLTVNEARALEDLPPLEEAA
jgi:HK97 family phage portal protein